MKRFKYCVLLSLLWTSCIPNEVTLDHKEIPDQPEDKYVVRASFECPDTRTMLSMDEASEMAQVLWNAGDRIRLIGLTVEPGSSYVWELTTEDEGTVSASFGTVPLYPDVERYLGYYPSSAYRGSSDTALGLSVPPVQQAVAGGVERGMLRSFAVSTSQDDELRFRNLLSLVKFRLTGALVPEIATVRLVANAEIAGDLVVKQYEEACPVYDFCDCFEPKQWEASPSIDLSGPFEAGQDYYFAAVPAVTDGFALVFLDAQGNYLVKQSFKTLTLSRSCITNLGTIDIGSSFGDPKTIHYMTQTRGNHPVDICVLADGYTASQQSVFETRAAQAMDYMFSVEPYKTYKDYFNVYIMWTPSKEAGRSITDGNGNLITLRNTVFHSRWGSGSNNYHDMTADSDRVYGYVTSHCPDIIRGECTIDDVSSIILINTTEHAGMEHVTATGRNYSQFTFAKGGSAYRVFWSNSRQLPNSNEPGNNGHHALTAEEKALLGRTSIDWRNGVLHELGGHGFGRLLDEFFTPDYVTEQSAIESHSWEIPYGLNVSGFYDTVPWEDILSIREDLMQRDERYGRIGRYQGGQFCLFNRWRSEFVSCMIDDRPYFSTWQRLLIVRRIKELAGEPFDFNDFLDNDVTVDPYVDAGIE